MQTSAQDPSVILGNLLQAPASSSTSLGQPQAIGTEGELPGADFLASLESSLQALSQGEQSSLVPFDPSQLLATFEQYLGDPSQLPGGNGLPLEGPVADAVADSAAVVGADALTPDLRELLARLKAMQANGTADAASGLASQSPRPAAAALDPLVMTPLVADEAAQALLDQRRLFERFQALPEVRQAADLSASALRQAMGRLGDQPQLQQPAPSAELQQGSGWLGSGSADLALTPTVQGGDFAMQMAKMAELKNITLSSQGGAALDALVKGDAPDLAALPSAGLQRQTTPAALAGDARPAAPAFIHVPLNDPQWQSEFSNRVTWLARAGGNQSAEIRLNPANMGPIEVRVVMNDDQATITFTAQHGVVRDAIEASLPRLREMFSGSGLQLANANVSDQSLQQRQHQQQGFGEGGDRAQKWYGQADEQGDLISPIALSASRPSMLVDRLDLYA